MMRTKQPSEYEQLSDDELAILERAMETGDQTCIELGGSRRKSDYRSAYRLIHELTSPIRNAIESLNSPPILEDYEELTKIASGGMGVVYRGLNR